MKTSELMIGDWVHITDDDTDAHFYAKVEAIDRVGNIYVKAPGDETAYPYSIDCVKPIPLTSEILEKNGWRSIMDGTGDFYLTRLLVNAATVTKNIIGFQMNHGPFNGLSIHYVHKLQHALRLCDIEIEIKL